MTIWIWSFCIEISMMIRLCVQISSSSSTFSSNINYPWLWRLLFNSSWSMSLLSWFNSLVISVTIYIIGTDSCFCMNNVIFCWHWLFYIYSSVWNSLLLILLQLLGCHSLTSCATWWYICIWLVLLRVHLISFCRVNSLMANQPLSSISTKRRFLNLLKLLLLLLLLR